MYTAYSVANGRICIIPGDQIESKLPEIMWIDLNNPTREEEQSIEKLLQIDIPTQEEMTGLELSNRLYQEDGATYLVMSLITNLADEPEMKPYIFVVTDSKIVTVRYADTEPFRVFTARMQNSKNPKNIRPDLILIGLLEATINRLADILEGSGHKLDMISKRIFRTSEIKGAAGGTDKSSLSLLAAIREIGVQGDVISMAKESLISLSRLIGYSRQTSVIHPDDANHERLVTLSTDVMALNEHATFMTDKTTFLLDATVGMIGIQQNSIMKIFSILAVFFLPPTLVAGIYGMNFKHMPDLEWVYGYPMALGIMFLSAYLPYRFFRHRGWL